MITKSYKWLIICCYLHILFIPIPAHSEEPLVFVSAPDWHGVDNFLNPSLPQISAKDVDIMMTGMARAKPAFIIMPGDLGAQHWWEPFYQNVCAPNGDLQAVIMNCAAKSYPPFLNAMARHGLNSVFLAVGDHEIGDDVWSLGRPADAVPYFKKAFAKYFTQNADGSSKFNGFLGGIPLRPIGTAYENTSYAFQAGNTLFVSVDQFQQLGTNQLNGLRGTVRATVGIDGHIGWLNNLLSAARKQPSIKHIIVFGHLPVLSPVRSRTSSSIYIDWQQNSLFWQALRNNHVDLYLAGEVHDNTVIKDPISHLVQVAHASGASGAGGFIVGRIYSDRIELDKQIRNTNANGDISFVKEGTLMIDKAQDQFKFWATGNILKPLDKNGLIMHYSFDENMATIIKNHGSFASNLDGTNKNVNQISSGVFNAAASFNNSKASSIISYSMTPVIGSQSRTISAWIKTTASSKAYLYPAGSNITPNGLFRILVNNGILGVQIDTNKELTANQGDLKLNNNNWHHIAVTFPGFWSVASDTRFYIDGIPYLPNNTLNETIYTRVTTLNIGGKMPTSPIEGWSGAMDDFGIWASALTPPMIRAVQHCGLTMRYNASSMEALFKLYRNHPPNPVNVNGLFWKYSIGLSGNIGFCEYKKSTNTYTLMLDSSGNGVSSTTN